MAAALASCRRLRRGSPARRGGGRDGRAHLAARHEARALARCVGEARSRLPRAVLGRWSRCQSVSIPNGYKPPAAVCDISAWQCMGKCCSVELRVVVVERREGVVAGVRRQDHRDARERLDALRRPSPRRSPAGSGTPLRSTRKTWLPCQCSACVRDAGLTQRMSTPDDRGPRPTAAARRAPCAARVRAWRRRRSRR